jgi:hypothetical protein
VHKNLTDRLEGIDKLGGITENGRTVMKWILKRRCLGVGVGVGGEECGLVAST